MSHSVKAHFSGKISPVKKTAADNNKMRPWFTGVFMLNQNTNVVAFKPRAMAAQHHQKSLMERIYTAGSLAVRADDVATKTAAVMLQALGFLLIEEILADGTPRPIKRGEARKAMDRPWRLLKPAFSGEAGVPDAVGAFPV